MIELPLKILLKKKKKQKWYALQLIMMNTCFYVETML